MIRLFDIFFSLIGLFLLFPLMVIIWILIRIELKAPIFKQTRLGINKIKFTLYKYRTMKMDTASLGSHLVNSSQVTKLGHYLRKYKLDELPQLYNVLIGDMSLVGPRPCLSNQSEVINERDKNGIFSIRPGITGTSQLKKIDMSTPKELAISDKDLINKITLFTYFNIIFKTAIGKGRGDANIN